METAVRHRYPVKVETLYRILVSRDFFRCRYQWGGVRDYRFECFEQQGDTFLVCIAQPILIPADRLPPMARRLLPGSTELITEFRWQRAADGYRAGCRLTLAGAPLKAEGHMLLRPDENGGGAVQQVCLDVHCTVPVLGRKLERLVAQRLGRILDGDYRHTLRYIEQSRPQE